MKVVEAIQDLGLSSRGAGADNIRNVTGTPTAGIDPQELIDTRPFAREWHFHVLNDRSLTGLPRKFNVAFDGAGQVAALEETNDIGFQAVEVADGAHFPLASISGSCSAASPATRTSPAIRASSSSREEATRVADAIVRVFIEHGDRTNRNKARLKYVLDAWGFEKFLAAVEEQARHEAHADRRFRLEAAPCRQSLAHVGVHPQKQEGLSWIGVVLPVGKLTVDQMRGLAAIARELGDGDIRLTVWQNLILSGVPVAKLLDAVKRIEDINLSAKPTAIRAGLVACTGSTGCKFAASNTKGTAEAIARHVESRLALDQPVNIHLTGCHHSCAQHYIGDIGLIGDW